MNSFTKSAVLMLVISISAFAEEGKEPAPEKKAEPEAQKVSRSSFPKHSE